MTEITPELQRLADAALSDDLESILNASAAYRATQAEECRPPANAKDGSLWWLAYGDVRRVMSWTDASWRTFNCSDAYTMPGWTVHSECRFGETGVEATKREFPRLAEIMELAVKYQYVVGKPWQPIQVMEFLRSAFRHFRAPKLEISDEAYDQIGAAYEAGMRDGLIALDPDAATDDLGEAASDYVANLRAVIAKVGGEK